MGRMRLMAFALLLIAAPWARAASEAFSEQVFYRDVAVSTWGPTVTVSSITTSTGGAFAVTGTWFYAVAAQNSLGKTTNGPVTNVVVTATGYYVRVTWPSYGGATNYLLYRGMTATNLTNYVNVAQQGATNVYTDYGTNSFSVGVPSNSITAVPWLKLPSASYTPSGNDAVRASDIAGYDASNYYTRAQADAAFVNTNETNSVTTQMITDGTIVGADLAAGAVSAAALGTNAAVSTTNFDASVDARYLDQSGDIGSGWMLWTNGSATTISITPTGTFGVLTGLGTGGSFTNSGKAFFNLRLNTLGSMWNQGDDSIFNGFVGGASVIVSSGVRSVIGNFSLQGGGTRPEVHIGGKSQFLSIYSSANSNVFNVMGDGVFLMDYLSPGGTIDASGSPIFYWGTFHQVTKPYGVSIGRYTINTNFGSVVMSSSTGFVSSLRDYDFTMHAQGGARMFLGTNGLKIIDQSSNTVVTLGGLGGMQIGTNSIHYDSSGNMTATGVWIRLSPGESNDQPVTVGQMNSTNAAFQQRPTNGFAFFYSDGGSNLVPLALGQAGSVPVSQGSNSAPIMQLPTATATNVGMSNITDVASGTPWTTNHVLRFNGAQWVPTDQTNLTVGAALNAGLLDGYDSSAFQLYLGPATNNGGFLVGYTNGTYGWAPSLTADATNVVDSDVRATHVPTNYTASASNLQAHARGIDAELGALAAGTGNASRIHGRAISTNAPTHGQVYQWDTNTSSFLPATIAGGGSGVATSLQGVAVSTNAPTHGQVLEYSTNCACWLPAADDTGAGGATNVVFENLDANGDVGSGSNQLARGSVVVTTVVPTNAPAGVATITGNTLAIGTNDSTSAGGSSPYSSSIGTNCIVPATNASIEAFSAWSTIAGGYSNMMDASYAFEGSGYTNQCNANYSLIGAGKGNFTIIGANYGAIVAGLNGTLGGTAIGAFIGAGEGNNVAGWGAAAVSGQFNTNSASFSFIGSGTGNKIDSGAGDSFIGGGYFNHILDGVNSSDAIFIGGGDENTAADAFQVLNGGYQNSIGAASYWATVGGGRGGTIGTSADGATIPGGRDCSVANNATNSFALGRKASASHHGCFVWADDTNVTFASTAANQFDVRASGGANFGTNAPWSSGSTQAQVTVSGYLYADHIVTSTGSIQIGQTSLQETQLKSLYTSRKLTWAVVWLSLLLVGNFIRDRVRERENKRRDVENSRRIRALERQLGIGQ